MLSEGPDARADLFSYGVFRHYANTYAKQTMSLQTMSNTFKASQIMQSISILLSNERGTFQTYLDTSRFVTKKDVQRH